MIQSIVDNYAPHISDPDDPNEAVISPADAVTAAKIAAVLYPEMVDHSMDGPILAKPLGHHSPEAQLEVSAWNSHRARHRGGVTPAPKKPRAVHTQSDRAAALHGFTVAIHAAEKHRRVLKQRFGYSDRQIGTEAMIHQKRLTKRN